MDTNTIEHLYTVTVFHLFFQNIWAEIEWIHEAIKLSSFSPCLPAPCLHSRNVDVTPGPALQREERTLMTPQRDFSQILSSTLTAGVLWEASCCRSGNGVQWMGSTGQLQTDRSLAFPESNTPSPTLTPLPRQPYWELQSKYNVKKRCMNIEILG